MTKYNITLRDAITAAKMIFLGEKINIERAKIAVKEINKKNKISK